MVPEWKPFFSIFVARGRDLAPELRERSLASIPYSDDYHTEVNVTTDEDCQGKLAMFLQALPLMAGEVYVELDGDDFFSTPEALREIKQCYDNGADATFGNWYIPASETHGKKHPQHIPPIGKRLSDPMCNWAFEQPHTMRLEYLRRVPPHLWLDPETDRPWMLCADTAIWCAAMAFAPRIDHIRREILTVDWSGPYHDGAIYGSEAMLAMGARIIERWREWQRQQ